MRKYFLLIATGLLLSACNTTSNKPEMREARSKNAALQKTAYQNARKVQIDGLQFNVAVVQGSYVGNLAKRSPSGQRKVGAGYIDKRYALVELISPRSASYTSNQVESAARSATGCGVKFALGALAFARGFDIKKVDLRELDKSRRSRVRGWRVDLSC